MRRKKARIRRILTTLALLAASLLWQVAPGMKDVLAASVSASGCCSAKSPAASPLAASPIHDIYERLMVNGKWRDFYLHFPPGFDPHKAYPLVILLHGGGGNYRRSINITSFDKKADQEGFILALPDGTGYFKLYTWNSENCCGIAKRRHIDDVSFIRFMISRIESEYTIDKQRVYVAGESNGGMLAYKLACEMSDEIAAIAPVAAGMSGRECKPASPVSVIAFNGTADKTVPYDGGVGIAYMSRYRIAVKPVAYAISFWTDQDRCEAPPIHTQHGNVGIVEYGCGVGGCEVEQVTIKDGNHCWPGGKKNWLLAAKPSLEISATDTIWEFFKAHPKTSVSNASVAAELWLPKPSAN